MDVPVDESGRKDLALACDRLRTRSDDDVDARLDIRIAGLANADDLAVLDANVGLDDAPVIDDERVGDDGVDRAFAAAELRLPHAVADDLAAAELHLLAIDGEILFHLDDQVGVGEADLVACGRAEHLGIGGAGNLLGHGSQPFRGQRVVSADATFRGLRYCPRNETKKWSR